MKRKLKFNNHGQMLVYEVITFAILLIISVIFVYQLTPQTYSTSTRSSDELAIIGYDTLRSLDKLPYPYVSNYPGSLKSYLSDETKSEEFFWLLNHSLPSFVDYNVYVSYGNVTKQWPTSPDPKIKYGSISCANYIISLDSELPGFEDDGFYSYNVILEM